MEINKIAHIADIHIRKSPKRNNEYYEVFNELYKSLKEYKPDRIVIVGDLVNDYIELQGEQLILVSSFLNNLSSIAQVRITRGNHDCRKKNLSRIDSIKAIVEVINNPNIKYYDESGFYEDENIIWAVWHHGQDKNNPYKTKEYKNVKSENKTIIDLFHDPVNGCKSNNGYEMNNKYYNKISDFKGDFSFFGDIHKKQYLNKDKTKAYCGSLIAQDFSEGDDNFHGYLLWDIKNKIANEISIINNYHSYQSIDISQFTDFDDLDFDLNNNITNSIRFIWKTLPDTKNKININKLNSYVNNKLTNYNIYHKELFIDTDNHNSIVNEDITITNINDNSIQQGLFKDYLIKIGCDDKVIEDVIKLDNEISKNVEIENNSNIEWEVIKVGGVNFMSYENIDLDWSDKNGIFQISGICTAGKTTIFKLISYVLFGKSLETENRIKFGDIRFINNRNGANSCSGYVIIKGNNEYYGITRSTTIERGKDGQIKSVPTVLNYYLLSSPNDELLDINNILKLDDDNRIKTQNKIESIIGTYDNYIRIVLTTSDTLNRILSNDMSVFIDSLLIDSGLDVFDKKLSEFKVYQKKINSLNRISCNVDIVQSNIDKLNEINDNLNIEIDKIKDVEILNIQNKIEIGENYIEDLNKSLHVIDSRIYSLDINSCNNKIKEYSNNITENNNRIKILESEMKKLEIDFDENRYNECVKIIEDNKNNINSIKFSNKDIDRNILNIQHEIEILSGKILTLKNKGSELKIKKNELKESKICPVCHQELKDEHKKHIDDNINKINDEMLNIANEINSYNNIEIPNRNEIIEKLRNDISLNEKLIENMNVSMEGILNEIGILNNIKNDLDKYNKYNNELSLLPLKNENENLKIKMINDDIDNYNNNLIKIEENKKNENKIILGKERLNVLKNELEILNNKIIEINNNINNNKILINNNIKLINDFNIQEYNDHIMDLYKKCVHRDGIPRQMLINYIVPKINQTLSKLLVTVPFKVWLDLDDLRLKLAYDIRPDSIIDCISASGKERTFSSVVLKFALNQINIKSKPMMFLLDEVMGKLDLDGSVDEFIEIIQIIKNFINKILIVEHVHEINPDYIIKVNINDEGISKLELI